MTLEVGIGAAKKDNDGERRRVPTNKRYVPIEWDFLLCDVRRKVAVCDVG